jgi:hypothetical protein
MSSLDFDLDLQMSSLEREWRQAYEASISARAEYHALASSPKPAADLVRKAREHLERTEELKARVMAKIGRLEDNVLGQD